MALLEKRYSAGIEIRAEGDTESKIGGYAIVYDSPTKIGGTYGWQEIIKPGAASRSIRERHDVRALYNHDPSLVLGRVQPGTLVLREDTKGVNFEVTLPDTQTARDLVVSIKRGDVTGCSFGFRTVTDNWRIVNGSDVREIFDVDLIEVSPVAFPAYEDTSVQVRLGNDEDKAEKLSRALFRTQRGLALDTEDQVLLTEVRSWLEHNTHPPVVDPVITRTLERMKRVLQLKRAA